MFAFLLFSFVLSVFGVIAYVKVQNLEKRLDELQQEKQKIDKPED
ncbi:hypothetical protein SAMN06297229_2151 [Pseudidiomarina planktonica]|uniref:Uncharacterized protein n=1 Tax=Pseudidiomarina planktonica TaxID=1323738 RepID=A0A1Y6G1D0_9GAMM|nr:hypothetical protein [Pseudidiomarina planktonica]SMQ80389.1 hypothetical protein SAMN06297229_2151 [Pseudidiomarina planktonica]